MNCPWCSKELDVPDYAVINATTYRNRVKVVTNCCGNMVSVTPLYSYRATKYTGTETVDDWGNSVVKGNQT